MKQRGSEERKDVVQTALIYYKLLLIDEMMHKHVYLYQLLLVQSLQTYRLFAFFRIEVLFLTFLNILHFHVYDGTI